MRENNTNYAYTMFVTSIVPVVVGRYEWKQKAHKVHYSTFVTPSDEAFGMLLVENNYEAWVEIAQTGDKGDKKPKYTKHAMNSGRYGGWSTQGIRRYNELIRIVKEDRRKDKQLRMNDRFEEHIRLEVHNARAHKNNPNGLTDDGDSDNGGGGNEVQAEEPMIELSDDEDNESSEQSDN